VRPLRHTRHDLCWVLFRGRLGRGSGSGFGDVVLLRAGSIVPADGVILDATDFFVSEGVLTGESISAT
jgi:hypothetical protein